MKKIHSENLKFERQNLSYAEAKNIFKDNPYKLELTEEHKDDQLSLYQQGEFIDLCVGHTYQVLNL